jgi:crotonobetainyl-CoA:carnitine CoA-transferase CaiB-like acyl-CoA transferase
MILGISSLSQGVAGSLPPRGTGHLDGGLPNYNIYATKDGRHMAVGALEPHFWKQFCKHIKAEKLIGASADKVTYNPILDIGILASQTFITS